MKKWIFSMLAGIAGAAAGLWYSENFMYSRLFLGGIEVDLSDPMAVEWALANPTKSEWLTYFVLGQDIVMMQPGSYWTTAVPIAFAVMLFSIIFIPASLFARQKPEPRPPFLKAPSSSDSAQSRKAARLTGEISSSATPKPFEKPDPGGPGDPLADVNGLPVELDGSVGVEAEESRDVERETQQQAVQETQQNVEPETQQEPVQETQREAAPETQQKMEPELRREATSETQRGEGLEEAVQILQEEVADTPEVRSEEPLVQEIRVKEPAPEETKPLEGNPEILKDEAWKTHYDYLDPVRMIFDKLRTRGEHMAIDFATRYMVDPKGSDLETIVAQILEEERQRNRFSDNDAVEAAHVAMMEFSDEAAAEFRRVIRILGEDVDLNNITQKIRQRFPKTDKRSGIDPYQMNESQIISELRGRGFEIIAPAGGPYSVKDTSGSRITKPIDLLELQEFLKEQRSP